MNNSVDLSIIIVSWNVRKLLLKCLRSIFENKSDLELEVFVVDNGSSDGSVGEIEKYRNIEIKGLKLEILNNKENLGFAKANNQAIKKAQGGFVLLLNPDTEIKAGVLEKMVKFMREHKGCGVAGCKLLNPDESIQPSVRSFPTFWSQVMVLLKLHHVFPNARIVREYFVKDFDYSAIGQGTNGYPQQGTNGYPQQGTNGYPQWASAYSQGNSDYPCCEVDQVMGAFFMFRREVIERIGMLDENFYIWFEEVDFCKRVKKAGYKVCYTPTTGVIHHGAQSFSQVLSIKKQLIFNRSLLYYFRKHHSWRQWFGLYLLQTVSLGLAGLVSLRPKQRYEPAKQRGKQ